MFEITDETKLAAIDALRDVFGKYGCTEEELEQAFESALAVVKQQFGL